MDLGATTTSTLYMSVCVWIWLIPTNALNEISHMYRPDLLISSCQSAEKGFLGASGCVCVYIEGGCVLGLDLLTYCMISEAEIDMTKQY